MPTGAEGEARRPSELAGVVLLSLGFGLVGIDRFLISTMYPSIARDLRLGYADVGVITGALALAWGVAALIMGNLADRLGSRIILIVSMIAFSLLIGTSGLATGLAGLVAVRVVMGLADGAYTPASIAATIALSPADRRGRNVGFQQTMLVLFGLALSPLLVGALLRVMTWRYIFVLFTLPGLLIAGLMRRTLPAGKAAVAPRPTSSFGDWGAVLAFRNIRLLMAGMLCWLTCLIITSAFLPSYLTDHLKLSTPQMTGIMSAIGFGAVFGTVLLSWLSDRIGRKPVMLVSTLGAVGSLVVLATRGADPSSLFVSLFFVHFFNNALITLTVGPICAETAPPALMATASGVVIATGELFGGGVAPILGGQIAERFGIANILWLPVAALGVGFVICSGLQETRPRRSKPVVQNYPA